MLLTKLKVGNGPWYFSYGLQRTESRFYIPVLDYMYHRVIQKHHTVSQSENDDKKQRVLHTRVSERLDSELREKAAGLGVSVSKLVRNILLNTVEIVEDIVIDSTSIGRAISSKTSEKNEQSPAIVLGWQELTLNLNALCEQCNTILPKGGAACIAVCDTKTTPIFRCQDCVSGLFTGSTENEES